MGRSKRVVLLTDEVMEPRKQAFPGVADPWSTRAVFAIRALAQGINDAANTWLAPFGLTATKYNYLVTLYRCEGQALSLNELSGYIHTSNASVTSVIDALEKDDLVERVEHPSDRRSVLARLTRKGRAATEEAFPAHHHNIELMMSRLNDDERRMLVALLV